jgi:hypothetical protein
MTVLWHPEVTKTRYPTYDGNKVTERPVNLDKTEGHVIIEGRTYPAKEVVEALAQSGYAEMRTAGDSIVLGNKRIAPIFKSRQERAMASLCHGSFAYCCPLSKRCAERDRALEILGLTPNDYENLKKNEHFKYIDTAKGMGCDDSQWTSQAPKERIANKPAIDIGYGSEDYRHDFETLDRAMESEENRFDGRRSSWEDSQNGRYSSQYHEKEARDVYADLQSAVPTDDERSCSVCNIQRNEATEGIGALFTQGELSPFIDDTQRENQDETFCFSCGRNVRKGNRVCPYCGARL